MSVDKYNNIFACGTFWDSITFGPVRLVTAAQYPSFIVKFDSMGHGICGTEINNYNDDYNAIATDPLSSKVYFGGDVQGSSCMFGGINLTGIGLEFSFLAKWEPCPSTEGIDPINNSTASINLFPNPNNGAFSIGISSNEQGINKIQIEVYNMLGEKVYSNSHTINYSPFTINLSQPNGVYLYRVLDENGISLGNGKFIIQK